MKPSPHAEPMTDLPEAAMPASTPVATPSPGWSRAPERPVEEKVKNVLLVVALALLAISIAVAYYSANAIVSIWFEHQWAPVARLVLALVIAGVAAWAVVRLTRRKDRDLR